MHHDEHQSQGKVLIGPVKIKIIRAKKVKAKRKERFTALSHDEIVGLVGSAPRPVRAGSAPGTTATAKPHK